MTVGVNVGDGIAVGSGVDVGVGDGSGVGVGGGVGEKVAVGSAVGGMVGSGVGVAVGGGVSVGTGVAQCQSGLSVWCGCCGRRRRGRWRDGSFGGDRDWRRRVGRSWNGSVCRRSWWRVSRSWLGTRRIGWDRCVCRGRGERRSDGKGGGSSESRRALNSDLFGGIGLGLCTVSNRLYLRFGRFDDCGFSLVVGSTCDHEGECTAEHDREHEKGATSRPRAVFVQPHHD